MSIEKKIIKKARKNFSLIVLPEAQTSDRVLQAGLLAAKKNIARIVFLGDESLKQYENVNIKVINPKTFENKEVLISSLFEKRKEKGITREIAAKMVEEPLCFGTMLVECGFADGMVAGAVTKSADVLRSALQIIKGGKGIKTVSSAFIMSGKTIKNKERCLILSDCALNIAPNAEQLADIAVATAKTARTICDMKPALAFLSFTTMGGAETEDTKNIAEAIQILKDRKVDFDFDGELQVDAAIVPEVARLKAPKSTVAGRANCLIFPNVMAGNIGYKLFQRGGQGYVNAIGPFTQGLNKPVNDLSRGANIDEIVMSIALTAVQADTREK